MGLTREEARYVMEVSLKRAKEGKPSIVREILDRRVRDELPARYHVNGRPVFHLKPKMQLDGNNLSPYALEKRVAGKKKDDS